MTRAVSIRRKSMYEILNGDAGNVVYEINLARVAGCPDPGDLFMKMWIFIHGAACMSLTGDYDLTDSADDAAFGTFLLCFLQ